MDNFRMGQAQFEAYLSQLPVETLDPSLEELTNAFHGHLRHVNYGAWYAVANDSQMKTERCWKAGRIYEYAVRAREISKTLSLPEREKKLLDSLVEATRTLEEVCRTDGNTGIFTNLYGETDTDVLGTIQGKVRNLLRSQEQDPRVYFSF